MARRKKKLMDKEVRRIMEGMSDLVKKRGDKYKFKKGISKKQRRKVMKSCLHWLPGKKDNVDPIVVKDPQNPMNWMCTLCKESFPVRPKTPEEYNQQIVDLIATINQVGFWAVNMGGDKDDTRLFLELRTRLPRFNKAQRNIVKKVQQRQQWEDRKSNTDSLAQFDSYAGFNYRS